MNRAEVDAVSRIAEIMKTGAPYTVAKEQADAEAALGGASNPEPVCADCGADLDAMGCCRRGREAYPGAGGSQIGGDA